MAFNVKYPLDIATTEGDGKQSGFQKLINEFVWIYGILSGLFSPATGHNHTGAVNDGPKIGAMGIENEAVETNHFASDAVCPKATEATTSQTCSGNSLTATTAESVAWAGVSGKPTLAAIPNDYVVEQVLGVTGFTRWHSGKIEQWGTLTTDVASVFPTPFLTACFGVFPNTHVTTTDPITVPTFTLTECLPKTVSGAQKTGTYFTIGY